MSYVIQRGPQFYHPAGWRTAAAAAARYESEDAATDDRDELLARTLAGQRGELQVVEIPR